MREEAQRRVARNEILFRETNEAIERGQWPGEPDKVVQFRCECSRPDCGDPIEVMLAEYERVREFPRRFLIVDGHEIPEIETVVERAEKFAVVEKTEAAGDLASVTDPRA